MKWTRTQWVREKGLILIQPDKQVNFVTFCLET